MPHVIPIPAFFNVRSMYGLIGSANHAHSVALFAMYYNFVRIHKTLRTTPAMAANLTKHWEIGDIVDVLEAWEASDGR